MVEYGQKCKQNPRVYDTLAQTSRDYKGKVLPSGIVELQTHYEEIANAHEQGTSTNEIGQFAPARHDDTRDETTDRCCQGWNSQSSSSFGRCIQQDHLEQQWKSEEELCQLEVKHIHHGDKHTAYAAIPTQTLDI